MSGRALDTPTRKQAIGQIDGRLIRVVCGFNPDTWWHIRGLAANEKISVSEQVRRLCAEGLRRQAKPN